MLLDGAKFECIVTPHIEKCEELPNPKHRRHDIVFHVKVTIAGYELYYGSLNTFDLAFRMKTDIDKQFKILRNVIK